MRLLAEIKGRKRLFLLVTFFFIIFNAFPLFGDLTHIPVQYACILTVILLICLYPQSLASKPIKWFIIFITILIVNGLCGRYIHINGLNNYALPLGWRITIEIAWILPALLIMSILFRLDDVRLYKIIGYGSVVILTISFLYILPLIMNYSNILRAALHEDNLDFKKPVGLPDYTLMHSYTLMICGLCLYAKINAGKKKYVAMAMISLFFYVITQTAVSTSITLSTLIILFSIFYNDKNKILTFFIFLFLGILVYLAYKIGIILAFVDWLMPFFEDTAVSSKLQDLHDSIIGGQLQGGSFDTRANLHQISIDGFFSNPIIGGGKAGRHSHVFDLLGTVGIVGFIPFFMIVWTSVKTYIHIVPQGIFRKYMYLCFATACVFLYHKGIFGATGWLFMCVIGPCLIVATYRK